MNSTEEKKLIRQAVNGNVAAFEKLVTIHRRKIYSFALSITGGNAANASDIYQEALIKAFTNIHSFKGNSSFSTWLWVIAKNTFRDWVKKPDYNKMITGTDAITAVASDNQEKELEREEEAEHLRMMIAKLPMDFAEAITLVHLQEMSYEDAAAIIGISVNLLKVRVHRGKQKLIDMMVKKKKDK